MVAMCRPLIADPRLPKKMIAGRYDEVRQCMACNWCLDRLFRQMGCECPMNPAYGFEKEFELAPAAKPKKVMVIGGGVAGLQAALAASQRGHKVTLYEQSDKLGGQVKLASAFPRLYTGSELPKWLIAETASTSKQA
jgi:2,4-dienoyl-CoA reductase (NADPH2)